MNDGVRHSSRLLSTRQPPVPSANKPKRTYRLTAERKGGTVRACRACCAELAAKGRRRRCRRCRLWSPLPDANPPSQCSSFTERRLELLLTLRQQLVSTSGSTPALKTRGGPREVHAAQLAERDAPVQRRLAVQRLLEVLDDLKDLPPEAIEAAANDVKVLASAWAAVRNQPGLADLHQQRRRRRHIARFPTRPSIEAVRAAHPPPAEGDRGEDAGAPQACVPLQCMRQAQARRAHPDVRASEGAEAAAPRGAQRHVRPLGPRTPPLLLRRPAGI